MKTKLFLAASTMFALCTTVVVAQDTTVTNLNVDSSMFVGNNLNVGERLSSRDASIDQDLTVTRDLILSAQKNQGLTRDQILVVDPTTGVVKSGDLTGLMYSEQAPPQLGCTYDSNGDLIVWNPQWLAGPGKLYTSSKCNPDVRVGIGTSNPGARLHINTNETEFGTPALLVTQSSGNKLMQVNNDGLILGRELKLDVVAWPDYVFEESYAIMPLDELERYILLNNHLPNVPSACEMETNGVNVSQANVLLLEKVEELTLYLIELQKQLKEQQEQIEALKSGSTQQ